MDIKSSSVHLFHKIGHIDTNLPMPLFETFLLPINLV